MYVTETAYSPVGAVESRGKTISATPKSVGSVKRAIFTPAGFLTSTRTEGFPAPVHQVALAAGVKDSAVQERLWLGGGLRLVQWKPSTRISTSSPGLYSGLLVSSRMPTFSTTSTCSDFCVSKAAHWVPDHVHAVLRYCSA